MLAQLTTVKSRLGIPASDLQDDTLLTNAINAVSTKFDNHCGRHFSRTESLTYEFPASYEIICPDYYPIESVSAFAVKNNETDGWTAQSSVTYLLPYSSGGVKCTLALSAPMGAYCERGRITYVGGYVLPGTEASAGQTELPDDIENACVEQVAYWYQRRHQLGLTGVSVEGGGFQAFKELDLLPSVRSVLQHYKRILL